MTRPSRRFPAPAAVLATPRPAVRLSGTLAAAVLASTALLPAQAEPADDRPPIWIQAGRVLPMDGPPIEGGAVLVEGGKITAVGADVAAPAGAEILRFPDALLLPGFVELHSHVNVEGGINDTVLPHNMDLRTLDLLLQDGDEFDHAMRAGITTALVIPGSGSTIGGLGTLLKTAGPHFDDRVVRFPGALKIALHARGGNPARRAGDLGSTRLGLHHMLKVVMADAKAYHEAWVAFEEGRGPQPESNPRLEPLRGLWRDEFPIIFHAYGQNDTMTAIRIAHWGLGCPMVISHGVYDSFKISDVLADIGIPMNIGPRQFEFDESRFVGNAAELHKAGVPVSICTDAPVVDQDQLTVQAAMAVRLGLPWEAALRGLTIEPAKQIGIADRVGSLTPGKDADLTVFPGDPLDPRHAPVLVMVDGRITHRSGDPAAR